MNTAYRLFTPDGPTVSPRLHHKSRLDEMAKVAAVSPTHATVRFFFSDSLITIEGTDIARWMWFTNNRAPSEQLFVGLLFPNIEAAWHGCERTLSLAEAKPLCWDENGRWRGSPSSYPQGCAGQPIPGIFVRRAKKMAGEQWWDDGDFPQNWDELEWPLRPTREYMQECARGVLTNALSHVDSSSEPSTAAVALLLDYAGADLRFLSPTPLAPKASTRADPQACVQILGGPKGISRGVLAAVRDVFAAEPGLRLAEVCLGPVEQMAHACVAYLRIQEDAGLLRSAVADLVRVGARGYAQFARTVEEASRRAGRLPRRGLKRRSSRERGGKVQRQARRQPGEALAAAGSAGRAAARPPSALGSA